MTRLVTKSSVSVFLLSCLMILSHSLGFAQSKWKVLSEGIETTDSLFVSDEDTLKVRIIRNHWLGIDIQLGGEDASGWLGKKRGNIGWKSYKNRSLGITFDYPPDCQVTTRIVESDTLIELSKKVAQRPASKGSRVESKFMMAIWLTDNSFEDAAANQGFALKNGIWYADGVSPVEATYIVGNDWSALEGENTFNESVEEGGMATKADIIFVALKDLSPRRSARLDKSLEFRAEDFVGVVSSLAYLK